MKKLLALMLAVLMALTMAGCSGDGNTPAPADNQSEVQKIIAEAQSMTLEELAQKAIEESNGKKVYGVGNSSRGKSALPLFIEYLQTIDPNYTLEFECSSRRTTRSSIS